MGIDEEISAEEEIPMGNPDESEAPIEEEETAIEGDTPEESPSELGSSDDEETQVDGDIAFKNLSEPELPNEEEIIIEEQIEDRGMGLQ